MRTSFSVLGVMFAAVVFECATAGGIDQSPGEAVASDVQKHLPTGWTCSLVSDKGKMGHPHGLEEPLFRLDFVNANLTFREETMPGQVSIVHPNLRLHFHAAAERERIVKTIDAEKIYSWDIPTLFAETKEYIVITSPLWQNRYTWKIGDTTWGAGVYTEEANRLIAPLIQVLNKYFESRR
jgi:hypothetical protein